MIVALELDLPSPPVWLLNQIDHCVKYRDLELTATNKISLSNGYSDRMVIKDSIAYPSRFQKRYVLGSDAEQWISQLTSNQASWPTVSINEGSSRYHGPHVDAGRNYALTYMIDTGGKNVLTSWWVKLGNPAVIDDNKKDSRFTCDYDDQLFLLHQIKMQPGRWYLYNTKIIHSVENCEEIRVSLQMNVINPAPLLKFTTVDQ